MKGSLRERSPGVWQVRVSLGRDPGRRRNRYAAATVRGTKRDARRAAARLVNEADQGRIPLAKETCGDLRRPVGPVARHIEARGRAPKTLVENRRMAAAVTKELGSKDLQKLKWALSTPGPTTTLHGGRSGSRRNGQSRCRRSWGSWTCGRRPRWRCAMTAPRLPMWPRCSGLDTPSRAEPIRSWRDFVCSLAR